MDSKWIGGVVVFGAVLGVTPLGTAGQVSAQVSSQVTESDPTHMVVTNPQAMVRCGAGMAYYPVSELRQNAILVMDGETQSGWARVKYPSTASALVRIEYADIAADGKSLRLNREDALIAYNALAGAKGSWSKLVSDPLPRGTELVVTGEATNKQTGELAGYTVEAPSEARGYVRLKFLRPATNAEVEAWNNRDQEQTLAEASETTSDLPAVDPGAGEQPAVDPGIGQPTEIAADDQPAVDPNAGAELADQDSANLMDPMIEDDAQATLTEPETDVDTQSETTDAANIASGTPADVDNAPAVADAGDQNDQPVENAPPPLKISSLEELEEIFAAVQKQTAEVAEYGPLLTEVQRMYDETPNTPDNAGIRTALRQRLSVLKIRQRVQEAARANAAALNSAESRESEIVDRIRELEIKRSYAVVGRLLPSAVYDGQRLPRMYRVQSVDGTEAPRTLGYLRPSDVINLETMLGETIGVIGTPNLDPRLNLRIIDPIKIDMIHSVEGSSTENRG
ncbi:MAG: hypothetical protein Phyf2KO_21220 [Phycisphaerales bacterium]